MNFAWLSEHLGMHENRAPLDRSTETDGGWVAMFSVVGMVTANASRASPYMLALNNHKQYKMANFRQNYPTHTRQTLFVVPSKRR